jgi:hypothetical protein
MKPSRSIQSNEESHTATSLSTSKPPRTMPLNPPPHVTTSHPTNATRTSRQIVTNGHTSDEPPRGEKAGYGLPQVEKVPHHGTNPKRSEPQGVASRLDQAPGKQHDHFPSPPKDPPTSGRSSPSPAPGTTQAYSGRPQGPAPGELQEPRGIPIPPEKPVFHNEDREAAPSKTKGGHDPLSVNGQPALINVSSLVRHSTPKELPPLPIITINTPPRPVVLTLYILQAADHSTTPSVPISEHRPPTPPKAAAARLNSPSSLRVDRSGLEYNHGTTDSRDISQSIGSAVVIGGTAVAEASLTPLPPAFIRPLNDIVRGNSSTSSLVVASSDDGLFPRSTGVERRQSGRHAETMSRSASRRPQTEGMST